jgi:hypothetical protein
LLSGAARKLGQLEAYGGGRRREVTRVLGFNLRCGVPINIGVIASRFGRMKPFYFPSHSLRNVVHQFNPVDSVVSHEIGHKRLGHFIDFGGVSAFRRYFASTVEQSQ